MRFATLLAAAAVSFIVPTMASAQATDYVYVETNTTAPNSNSILAYSRSSSGQLTVIPGSPFPSGGSGYLGGTLNAAPEDSDQDIITNADRSLLFAVNSGSDTIAVFHIERNGGLKPVAGSPFASNGNNPVGLETVGNILYVVNKASDPGRPTQIAPNYTTFRILPDGSLVPSGRGDNSSNRLLPSTVSVAVGSASSQIHAIPYTNLLFAADEQAGLNSALSDRWEWRPLPVSDSDAATGRV